MNIGTQVKWSSQSGGYTTTKEGVVVGIVKPRTSPESLLAKLMDEHNASNQYGGGLSRNEESYIVLVPSITKAKSNLYWPLVSRLEMVKQPVIIGHLHDVHSSVNYHVLNNSIVLNYSGKTIVVSQDDARYKAVIACIREGRLSDIPSEVETEKAFEGSGLEVKDGLVYENDNPIPPELNARIIKHKELGIPFASLVKFWENLKQNPSYNSRQQLFAFLSHNGHPLTEDGCFIAYRGVTEDFKDKHTGKFDNSVGAVCEMERDLVDDNPNNTCSRGLHVACYDYAKGFGPQLVEVKINPKDVVAVPTDYNGTKMRTCRFEVVAVGDKLLTEAIYGQPETAEDFEEEEAEEEVDACDCGREVDTWFNFCPDCGADWRDK